ncbi:hypothetical protein K501DRAFT_279955 [Backusella circina FSU 941]|nr:hypothetical protein K501DRAFT_279955 [Backusella circina FSU 941]
MSTPPLFLRLSFADHNRPLLSILHYQGSSINRVTLNLCTNLNHACNSMNEEETAIAKNLIYTIVICGKPFNLSWRSLTSDGPENYFTRQFQKSSSRIIHIDRNPDNFEKVAKHLRGYSFVTKDEDEHHALISDAHYYGLDKLLKILNSFVYLNCSSVTPLTSV